MKIAIVDDEACWRKNTKQCIIEIEQEDTHSQVVRRGWLYFPHHTAALLY